MCEKMRHQTQEKMTWQEVVEGEGALTRSPQEPEKRWKGFH